MRVSKRGLLAGAAWVALLTSTTRQPARAQSKTGNPRIMEGPMLGATTATTALMWARANGPYAVSVAYSEHPLLENSKTTPAVTPSDVTDFCVRLELTGLKPATRYFYQIMVNGEPDDFTSQGPASAFVTAPPVGTKGIVRIGFGSCARYQRDRQQRIWDAVQNTSPDLFFWLGDNVYVDSFNPLSFGEEYRRQRSVAALQPILRTASHLAIWDDHDYGLNNHDRTNPLKDVALKAFQNYWANPSFGLADTPGVFFKHAYGDVDFFFLDARTYRDPNAAPDSPTKTMLGANQFEWIKNQLRASKATFKLLISGTGWSTAKGVGGDSWASFQTERNQLFDFIRDQNISGVVLLSGDTHVAELNCIPWSQNGGYDLYDLVSSPLAQETDYDWITRKPEVRVRPPYSGDVNFGYIVIDTRTEPRLTFNVVNAMGDYAWKSLSLTASDLVNGAQSWTKKIDRKALEGFEHLMTTPLSN
jgi:alkaline phosphatase D